MLEMYDSTDRIKDVEFNVHASNFVANGESEVLDVF